MPGHGTPGPRRGPAPNGRPFIDSTLLFSNPEGTPRHAATTLPVPATDPFQAPDLPDFPDADDLADFPEDEDLTPPATSRPPSAGRSRGRPADGRTGRNDRSDRSDRSGRNGRNNRSDRRGRQGRQGGQNRQGGQGRNGS
ncbi:hypothetical protein SUDANB70_03576 [Streptomyces sp. enrichment culture]